MAAASNGTEYLELQIDPARESFARPSNADSVKDDEDDLLWEAISKLPSQKRGNFALLRRSSSGQGGEGSSRTETIDVTKLDRANRELVVKKALATNAQDNQKLLSGIKERLDRVGLEVPKIEVRFEELNIEADVRTGSRALPSLINVVRDTVEDILTTLRVFRPKKHSLTILNYVSGTIKPGRMTLLLGPPGSGKSTLLLALAGKLDKKLKKTGDITYNGEKLEDFYVRRTSAYISQIDKHIAELTVRETLDFAASCQGASEGFAAYMKDLIRLEKERNIRPSPEIDAFMKASSVAGKKHSVSTDYILKVLGLDVCSETVVGSDMLRGVSGGQRKRVTTGEMIVGPRKTLFMDEISTGLDSSTTYQIVKCIGNFVHQMDATVLMALLQPPPETFDLFDDLVLLSEGYMVYQGPRAQVLQFFESLGFRLPPRKGVADFLQEVTSIKDQAQYWADPSKPYVFMPVSEIAEAFDNSRFGRAVKSTLSVPVDKSSYHPSALSKTRYAVSRWELLKACFAREILLIKRHRFLYWFRTCQVFFVGCITCTIFLRTRLHPTNESYGSLYLSCLFFGLVHVMFNGFSELSLLIFRLPVFYKQRDNLFHPGWAWSLASFVLRIPYSAVEAFVWSLVVYYTVGFAPAFGRFLRFMFLLFTVHQMALGLFRMMASITRDMVIANTFGSAALLIVFLLGGFIIPKESIKPWWIWAFWVSPLTYGQRAISVNEFGDERWMKRSAIGNNTIGYNILHEHSLPMNDNWYWISIGVLWLYAVLFNLVVTWALTYLNPLRKAQTVADPVDATEENSARNANQGTQLNGTSAKEDNKKTGMILPFKPLTMTFHNVNYFVDMPKWFAFIAVVEMCKQGIPEKKLQLLSNVSGVFSPGVLTALVGSSGAGKTTLMDVLAGRKTGGYIEGDIKISGYPKEQRTFARISGYVEQNDIHSPQVTVEESLWFSSSLRLPKEVTKEQRHEFVEEVMRLVELNNLRKALVGLPATSHETRGTGYIWRKAWLALTDYDRLFSGIPPITDGYNPATWMLEVTTPTVEERICEDFAELYKNSEQYRKQNLVYWRSPQYNAVRIFFTVLAAFILGSVFWKTGSERDSTQSLFIVMGALYSACLFLGVNNASSVQPIISIERTVFYREKAAGMYSPLAYAAAQGLVEVPYIILQTILYGIITYFMINFERTGGKFFLYLLFMFLTFTYFTFYGMMVVGLTPSQHMAAVVSSAFYSLWNLLSGFLIPMPDGGSGSITSAPLHDFAGIIISLLMVDVETHCRPVVVLVGFCVIFFAIFAFSVKFLNFQRRAVDSFIETGGPACRGQFFTLNNVR
ncbi:hypothetical protein GH714_035098 [Hevea brasiliensis]|uniref:ABC transporter domain-containing protein n=1 Tax=Hevea brasiliensis TaxID=3981 RepID=A0A6A6MI00_HEVBR|nr:hypothetical protein GH714_035098 [Hevea brasiliensis]